MNWDQLRGNLPSSLKRLILKCLRVDMDERPSIGDLLTDEYIKKLYNDVPTYYSKSMVSKVTADSEQERRPFEKVDEPIVESGLVVKEQVMTE